MKDHIVNIHGLNITFASYAERINFIDKEISENHKKIMIGYANSHTVVLSNECTNFRIALDSFSMIYADGVGVYCAAKLLFGRSLGKQRRQNATDFNYHLLQYVNAKRLKMFVIGAEEVVIKDLVNRINLKYPNIIIVGYDNGYFDINDSSLVTRINDVNSDVLLIGAGHPKQEIWVKKFKDQFNVPIIIVVGGFFNFFINKKMRAPKIVEIIGLEWFFRLIQEPKRLWKRYIVGIPVFCYLVIKQKLKS